MEISCVMLYQRYLSDHSHQRKKIRHTKTEYTFKWVRIISVDEIPASFKTWSVLGPIHTKDARFFCCGNSAADISKPHTFKWDPLAEDVLEAA